MTVGKSKSGNAGQTNHKEVIPYLLEWLSSKRQQAVSVGGEIGTLQHCRWEGKLVQPL